MQGAVIRVGWIGTDGASDGLGREGVAEGGAEAGVGDGVGLAFAGGVGRGVGGARDGGGGGVLDTIQPAVPRGRIGDSVATVWSWSHWVRPGRVLRDQHAFSRCIRS